MRNDGTLATWSFLAALAIFVMIGLHSLSATGALAAQGDINYNKNTFCPGEAVWFNHGDGIYCFDRVEDKNKYVFPHHWHFKRFLRGKFIKIETYTFRCYCLDTNQMEDVKERVAVIKTRIRGKTYIIRRPLIRTIPQQRLLLLNW
jgi:hypothetical protein